MSSAGGQDDDDDMISEAIKSLTCLVFNMNKKKNQDQTAAQLRNEILDSVEEEGIIEEEQTLLYHTNTRFEFGVKELASELRNQIDQ
ncbi:MAG: hypothetical protein EZS28_034295 [Streblomastix strix]|uniref:Uncharacterized protein n=1 Tax=Streblomastix strix TaxID=222440 RepID=A0A5J4UHJ3_9EUKA|nr:MAG: hypothetical protein EZS28_034295 [Streblomastix strix]